MYKYNKNVDSMNYIASTDINQGNSTGNISTQNEVRNQNIQDEITKKDSYKN